jgi:hypothetical protein
MKNWEFDNISFLIGMIVEAVIILFVALVML